MAKFKVPEPPPAGLSAADLVGRLVAINPIKEDVYETRHGQRPGFRVHVHEIICDHGRLVDVVDLGETVFWQQVLIDQCRAHSPELDGWLICRIVKPNRAYLPNRPEDDEWPAIEAAMDILGDPEMEPGDPFDDDPTPQPTPQPAPARQVDSSPRYDEQPF